MDDERATELDSTVELLRATAIKIERLCSRDKSDNTPASHRRFLEAVDKLGESTAPKLASLLQVSRQYAVRLASQLARSGEIESKPCPTNRRTRILSLTNKGLSSIRRSPSVPSAILCNLFEGLTAQEKLLLEKALMTINDNAGKELSRLC